MNRIFSAYLRRILRQGHLKVIGPDCSIQAFGDGTGPLIVMQLLDERVSDELLRNPELALGEAYMDGRIRMETGTIADLLMLVVQCEGYDAPHWPAALKRIGRLAGRRLAQFNPPSIARRNVKAHYDIGDDLYRLFLDPDWQYSCAYFEHDGASLEEAQLAKKRHLAAKLSLSPGQRVLDIGCGWGGLGLYLAQQTGADVRGITLSDEQLARAKDRARSSGLPNPPRFELRDYRKMAGTFDRIVSVGMFEHVGVGHYDRFFGTCRRLLDPDGVMVLHSIGRTGPPGATNPFISKYIFPGGYIPSLSEVFPALERHGFIVSDVEILRLHYAETLRHWRERFIANWQAAAELMDERFCRMWEFYLAGSEAAFRAGHMMVFQIQMVRSVNTLPIVRGYMSEAEAALRAASSLDADKRTSVRIREPA
ncbi:MAG: cyclopropane-fatty-acyl-phospholipid synthase family protein [Pseudomonadota bacterium]